MKKGPDEKVGQRSSDGESSGVVIPALLFLPIIVGILLFLGLAALADGGPPRERSVQSSFEP